MINGSKRYQTTRIVFILAGMFALQGNAMATPSPALVGADANNRLIVEAEWLAKRIDSSDVVILDVRPDIA